tara:strand:- start:2267 stop:2725 length:459 start_codon:yes stop_codon:yes gene_type:complete
MKLTDLKPRPAIKNNTKLNNQYLHFEKFIAALKQKKLSNKVLTALNSSIEELNRVPDNELKKELRKKQTSIIKILEKEMKIVPKNYYRNLWMALGMSIFGIPMGVVFGALFENMAFLGIGLPIGMAIGIAVGTQMDKKAFEEGRQLDVELKS